MNKDTISKSENQILLELNMMTRRYYLTYSSNAMVDEPLRAVLPGMKFVHPAYKKFRDKVMASFKQWKGSVLRDAKKFGNRWMASALSSRSVMLLDLRTFKELKCELSINYDLS